MITQRELSAVQRSRKRAETLAANPVVVELQAVEKDVAERLAALRERFEAGETVEPGRLALRHQVKTTTRVAWEKLLKALRALPAITKAIQKDASAGALLSQAEARNVASPYVSTASSVSFDVVPAE